MDITDTLGLMGAAGALATTITTLVMRYRSNRVALDTAETVAKNKAAREAMEAQTEAVERLMSVARPVGGNPDGSGQWGAANPGRTGPWPQLGAPQQPDPVLAAVADLGKRVDDLGKKVDKMGDKVGATLMDHAERIARIEGHRAPPRRRVTDEADSDRPGR